MYAGDSLTMKACHQRGKRLRFDGLYNVAGHTNWRDGNSGEDESSHPGCVVDILNRPRVDRAWE